MALYQVNDEVRTRLKHPLGRLIVGPPEKTIKALREVVEQERPTRLLTVGDVVASNILGGGMKVDFLVVDAKSKREPVKPLPLDGFEVVKVKNPAGVITREAYEAVRDACARLVRGARAIAVVVDGEEDLLTLPVVRFAPLGSLVVYGQPHVGIVLIRVTDRTRLNLEQIMEKMTAARSG